MLQNENKLFHLFVLKTPQKNLSLSLISINKLLFKIFLKGPAFFSAFVRLFEWRAVRGKLPTASRAGNLVFSFFKKKKCPRPCVLLIHNVRSWSGTDSLMNQSWPVLLAEHTWSYKNLWSSPNYLLSCLIINIRSCTVVDIRVQNDKPCKTKVS